MCPKTLATEAREGRRLCGTLPSRPDRFLLHYLWIKPVNENPNVIYVASKANMAIVKSVDGK